MQQTTTPPQDLALEQALLGLCLEAPENYEAMARIIQGDPSAVLYSRRNADIMLAMMKLMQRNEPMDITTIRLELTKMGKWNENQGHDEIMALYTAAMQNRGSAVDAIASHLCDLHMRRRMIEVCSRSIASAYDNTIAANELMSAHQSDIATIESPIAKFNFHTYAELVDPLLAKLSEQQAAIGEGKRDIVGQPTGSTLVDYHTGGDKAGELIIVAARPGEGKSTYVLQAAKAGARQGDAQAILSLEMDDWMQLGRVIADIANVPNNRVQQAKLTTQDWDAIHKVRDEIAGLEIYLDFCPGLTILQLEGKIRFLARAKGVKRIFIDYLQLMDAPTSDSSAAYRKSYDNENAKISQITKRLKQLAGECGIAIVLLSQMSRDVEKRAGEKRPMLSDLRGSGSIEQDANTILFLYSPASYEDTMAGYCARYYPAMNMDVMRRLTFIIIAKQRNGKVLSIPIWNDRKFCRMSDIREMDVYNRLQAIDLFDEDQALMAKLGIIHLSNQTELQFEQSSRGGAISTPITDEKDEHFFPF